MSSYTSLLFGFLAASAACAVDDRLLDVEQESAEPLAGAGRSNGSGGTMSGAAQQGGAMGVSPDDLAAAGGSGNDGAPDVAGLGPPAGGAGQAEEAEPREDAEDQPAPPTQNEPLPVAGSTAQVFLLFGQSNMWGVPAPQAEDLEVNPRVEVLTLQSCGRHPVDQWVVAQPPLHGCVGQPGGGATGPGLGPGDYFAKTLAAAFPEDTILLVPNAIPGVSIDVFQPGQVAYDSMVARAKLAQARGAIRGIIFHQGETDSGQLSWTFRVQTVVDQLRTDLGIGNVPFVAGELLHGGCCEVHNTLINQLPDRIFRGFVASAEGFAAVTNDGVGNLHFDLPSQRELGRRYGALMLDALAL